MGVQADAAMPADRGSWVSAMAQESPFRLTTARVEYYIVVRGGNSMVGKVKDETKEVYSLRLDRRMLKRIDEVVVRYHSLNYLPDFSAGEPPIPSRSQVLRWAVAEGLTVMEEKLAKAEAKKKGGSR
jgi:hypothetical protein